MIVAHIMRAPVMTPLTGLQFNINCLQVHRRRRETLWRVEFLELQPPTERWLIVRLADRIAHGTGTDGHHRHRDGHHCSRRAQHDIRKIEGEMFGARYQQLSWEDFPMTDVELYALRNSVGRLLLLEFSM